MASGRSRWVNSSLLTPSSSRCFRLEKASFDPDFYWLWDSLDDDSNASTKKVKSEDEESDFEPSKKTQKSKKPRPTKFLNKAAADTEEEEPQEVSDDDDLEVVAEADSQGFWEALEILDETATQYFIRWKGTDEKGKPWKPTWVSMKILCSFLRAKSLTGLVGRNRK